MAKPLLLAKAVTICDNMTWVTGGTSVFEFAWHFTPKRG